MKSKVILILLIFLLLLGSCSQVIPEDFQFELICGETFLPFRISTKDNMFSHYDTKQGFIMEDLNLTEEERKEIYREMKDVFYTYPTSFDIEREMIDDGNYVLTLSINGQSKTIYFQGEDSEKDGIALILIEKVSRIYRMINENRQ